MVAVIKSKYCMKMIIKQEVGVMVSNLVPRLQSCVVPEGAYILLLSKCG